MIAVALLALLQQPAPPAPPAPPPPPVSPIARAVVQPAEAALLVGDTLRLRVMAYDSAGRQLTDVTANGFTTGGFFEGAVDSTGLVTGGATGTVNVSALVRTRSGGRPATAFGRVTVLPQPAARIALAPAPARLYAGQSLVISAVPYAANDDRRNDQVSWSSDRPEVASVSASAQVRTGDVVPFRFVARAGARTLGDASPEWAMSPGSGQLDADGSFVADLPGSYRVFATFAGRVAEAVVEVRPRDVRRPTTLVGRLPIKMSAAEFWLHPDGQHGYLTTIGDRVYAIALSDPARPLVTDSVVVDARTINDLMTTEDGKFGVLTRDGASNRKNGIVVLSFEDPAHPRPIAEFTETVSGGVHSTFIYQGYVYLTDDATGSMRVIDIRDPYKPRQVARWETPRSPAGRTLHDIDVKDGLAYLSYWNDGLIILDVGNGVKGGSPEAPALVSQLKYDLNTLYRDVEAAGGPGFIRGTHTVWRAGKCVFVGDEVFSARPRPTEGGGVVGLGRAFGRLHVVDVSDLANPGEVAWYEPRDGGVHNVWVAGDTLYLGDYQGGLRVLDVSGEMRGDLERQGREIAHVVTGDTQGFVANAANTWGAIYRDGYIHVPDINSGLWIVRVEAKSELTP